MFRSSRANNDPLSVWVAGPGLYSVGASSGHFQKGYKVKEALSKVGGVQLGAKVSYGWAPSPEILLCACMNFHSGWVGWGFCWCYLASLLSYLSITTFCWMPSSGNYEREGQWRCQLAVGPCVWALTAFLQDWPELAQSWHLRPDLFLGPATWILWCAFEVS